MTGKKLNKNLANYYGTLSGVEIPIYQYDSNEKRELPCVVVGYSSEDTGILGGQGHYNITGFTSILFQGYDDISNIYGDSLADVIIDSLQCQELYTSVNKPLSGDSRPSNNFHLNKLIIRGVERNIEGESTEIVINYDAYTVAKDF